MRRTPPGAAPRSLGSALAVGAVLLATLLPRSASANVGLSQGARVLLLFFALDVFLVPLTAVYLLVAVFRRRPAPRPVLLGLGVLNGLLGVGAFLVLIGDGPEFLFGVLQVALGGACVWEGRGRPLPPAGA